MEATERGADDTLDVMDELALIREAHTRGKLDRGQVGLALEKLSRPFDATGNANTDEGVSDVAVLTMNDDGLADAAPLTPFVYPDFTQESVSRWHRSLLPRRTSRTGT